MTTLAAVYAAIRAVAVEEYVEGRSIAELSRQWGIPRNTLTDLMKRHGVYVPGRKGGAPTKTHCVADHDLAVHGKLVPGGGRRCTECKRIRERVTS